MLVGSRQSSRVILCCFTALAFCELLSSNVAAKSDTCAASLQIRNLDLSRLTTRHRYQYIETLDDEQFSRMKKDQSFKFLSPEIGKAAATSNTSSEFRKTLSSHFRINDYQAVDSTMLSWAFPETAYKAYADCLRLANGGLTAALTRYEESGKFQISVSWDFPKGWDRITSIVVDGDVKFSQGTMTKIAAWSKGIKTELDNVLTGDFDPRTGGTVEVNVPSAGHGISVRIPRVPQVIRFIREPVKDVVKQETVTWWHANTTTFGDVCVTAPTETVLDGELGNIEVTPHTTEPAYPKINIGKRTVEVSAGGRKACAIVEIGSQQAGTQNNHLPITISLTVPAYKLREEK